MAPETSWRRSGQLELAKVISNVAFVLRRVQRIDLPRQRRHVLDECLTASLQLLEELLDKPAPSKFVLGGGVPMLARLATRAPTSTMPDKQGEQVDSGGRGDGGIGSWLQKKREWVPNVQAAEFVPGQLHRVDEGDEPEDRAVFPAGVSVAKPQVDDGSNTVTDEAAPRDGG